MQGSETFVFIVKVTSADEKQENPGAKHRDLSVSRRGYRYFPPELDIIYISPILRM